MSDTQGTTLSRRQFIRRCVQAGFEVPVALAAVDGVRAGTPFPSPKGVTLGTDLAVLSHAAGRSPFRMQSAYSALSGANWPAYVAADLDLFRKYDLNVEMQFVQTSSTLMAAILSGQMPVAWSGGEAVVGADVSGADAVMIASIIPTFVFYIYSRPELHAPQDLKGKSLGVTRFGTSTDAAARAALTRLGLQPMVDVPLVPAGGVPEILAAIQAGAISAGVLSPPTSFAAEAAGLKKLVDITGMRIPYPQSCVASTRRFLHTNRAEALNFLKAMIDAIAHIKRDRDTAERILGKYTKINSKDILDGSYDIFAPLLPEVPTLPDAAVETAIKIIPRAAGTRPSQYVDNSLVQELEQSGFIRSVYR